jgi:hypothetical protein
LLPRAIVAFAFAIWLLSACSGGGGGGERSSQPGAGDPGPATAPGPTTVSGTVAASVALASYDVQVVALGVSPSPAGVSVFSDTTREDGRYGVTVTADQGPPFIMVASRSFQDAEPQYQLLSSIALRGGTANLTPLTDLLVTQLFKGTSPFILDTAELRNRTDADLAAARQEVLTYLLSRPSKGNGNAITPVDVSEVTDFVSMPLNATPGDPHFEALKRLHDSLMDTETIQGVEEHMVFRNDPPADLTPMLALDFMADCKVGGTDNGTLPRGATHITLNQQGATLGTLGLPFQPGTLLHVTGGQSGQTWNFSFAGGTFLLLFFFQDQLFSAQVFAGGGFSGCSSQTSVPAPSKAPSQMALIKRFTQSVTGNGFVCSTLVLPGFLNGSNVANIEGNGALRINGAVGPALHLPSMSITLQAELVLAGSQLTIRAKSLRGARFFKGGNDQVELFVNNTGQITAVFLVRQKDGLPSQTQSCGVI